MLKYRLVRIHENGSEIRCCTSRSKERIEQEMAKRLAHPANKSGRYRIDEYHSR